MSVCPSLKCTFWQKLFCLNVHPVCLSIQQGLAPGGLPVHPGTSSSACPSWNQQVCLSILEMYVLAKTILPEHTSCLSVHPAGAGPSRSVCPHEGHPPGCQLVPPGQNQGTTKMTVWALEDSRAERSGCSLTLARMPGWFLQSWTWPWPAHPGKHAWVVFPRGWLWPTSSWESCPALVEVPRISPSLV